MLTYDYYPPPAILETMFFYFTDFDDFAEPSEYLREKNIFNDMRLSEIESVIKSLKRAPKISESDNTSGEDS
jgi:hypothetical protein